MLTTLLLKTVCLFALTVNFAAVPASPPVEPSQVAGGPEDPSSQLFWLSKANHLARIEPLKNSGLALGANRLLTSPDPKRFSPLWVSTYRDLPRLGVRVHVTADATLATRDALAPLKAHAATESFQTDNSAYAGLAFLACMAEHATPENLLVDQSGTPDHARKKISDLYHLQFAYSPRHHVEALAYGLLAPERFTEYFATPWPGRGLASTAQRGGRWGGRDDFAARKAYRQFLEQDLPILLKWAETVGNNASFVGSTPLGRYDFERKGFELHLQPPKDDFAPAEFKPNSDRSVFAPESPHIQSVFLPIDPQSAEAFAGENPMVHFAMVGEFHGVHRTRSDAAVAGCVMLYDVTESEVELFGDGMLTKRLGRVDLRGDRIVRMGESESAAASEGIANVGENPAAAEPESDPLSAKTLPPSLPSPEPRIEASGAGPLWVLPSPDESTWKPIRVPAFRSKPLLGLATAPATLEAAAGITAQTPLDAEVRVGFRELLDDVGRSASTLGSLMRMHTSTASLDVEWLKQNYTGVGFNFGPEVDMQSRSSWFALLSDFAARNLTDAGLRRYFTDGSEQLPSNLPRFRAGNAPWGGANATEFERRRVVVQFLDQELPKLLAWARTAWEHRSTYVLNTTHLSSYLFSEQGFAVRMSPGSLWIGTPERLEALEVFRNKKFGRGPGAPQGVLVPMPPEEAETLKQRVGNSPLHYVFEVRTEAGPDPYANSGFTRPADKGVFEIFPVSEAIEFFLDPRLEQPLFSLPMR